MKTKFNLLNYIPLVRYLYFEEDPLAYFQNLMVFEYKILLKLFQA